MEKPRKTNFIVGEVAVLTELMKTNKQELFRKLSPSLTKQEKGRHKYQKIKENHAKKGVGAAMVVNAADTELYVL